MERIQTEHQVDDVPDEVMENLISIVINSTPEQRAQYIKEWKDRLE